MTYINQQEAESAVWPLKLHAAATNEFLIPGFSSLPLGATIAGKVRAEKESTTSLFNVEVDPLQGIATVSEVDARELLSLDTAWLTFDITLDGQTHRYRQGVVHVEPDGTNQDISPSLVDAQTIQDAIDQFLAQHGDFDAAIASATGQATISEGHANVSEGHALAAGVSATDAAQAALDFVAQHGNFNDAIAAAIAQAVISEGHADDADASQQAAQVIVDSLNATASFASDQFGAVSTSLVSSTNVVEVLQTRFLDMVDYGASLRAVGRSEYNVVVVFGKVNFYKLDGTLDITMTRLASPNEAKNWWRSSKKASCATTCGGLVCIGIDATTTSGVLFIDLITSELSRLGHEAAQSNRGLLLVMILRKTCRALGCVMAT